MFGQERGRDQAARPGMGIGLALVQELARAHGGRVEAQSEGPGCGASFTLWLPMPGSAAGLPSIPPSGANALSMPSPGA
jgi:two-component system CheB/CheR fusion protein